MALETRPGARTVEAVERAIAALDALAEAGEVGTNDLARRIGVHPSSVSRLLATLEAGGLVARSADSGRYRLGLRLAELGQAALGGVDLRALARPRLQTLGEATGETATLSVPGEEDAVTIDFVQSSQAVASVARVGRPSVRHATAVGKILLAFGGGGLPRGTLRQYTERTITDPGALLSAVDAVRAQGFAEARGEREPDLDAIAVPVFGQRGELAAILGVQGPSARFGKAAREAARGVLLHEARLLSEALGFKRQSARPGG
ncbi:MAG: IclR family transcriptional regulator [Gaiella sp.]